MQHRLHQSLERGNVRYPEQPRLVKPFAVQKLLQMNSVEMHPADVPRIMVIRTVNLPHSWTVQKALSPG
ncbi:hypothetical protein D3C73_1307780 [compost metagenome]